MPFSAKTGRKAPHLGARNFCGKGFYPLQPGCHISACISRCCLLRMLCPLPGAIYTWMMSHLWLTCVCCKYHRHVKYSPC